VWILPFARTYLAKMYSPSAIDCLFWRNHYLEISLGREENITLFGRRILSSVVKTSVMGLEILTAVNIQIALFWDARTCT
jgi:hypothetical protein